MLRLFEMKATQKLSEKIVTKAVVDFMVIHKWRAIRLQSGLFSRPLSKSRVRIGQPGMSDFLFLRPMEFIPGCLVNCLFVEFKAKGRDRTPLQQQWSDQAMRDGFDVICTHSFEDFEAAYKSRFSS